MTEDTRKARHWTGGVTAVIVAVLVALWLAGEFDSPPVQQCRKGLGRAWPMSGEAEA